MRWIVASLVIINIVSFAYFWLFAESESSRSFARGNSISIPNASSPSIMLLSEVTNFDVGVSVGAEESAPEEIIDVALEVPPELPVAVSQPLCTLVGSFKRLLKAEYFVEKLQALGLTAEIKPLIIDSKPGYWLHLSPEKSRKEALRRLSELQGRGIDSYVIPSGKLANGISLGMFSNKTLADAMMEKITSQGYSPQMTSVPREQKETWVFLPQGEASKISDERWSELLSSEDYIQKRQNVCADVASS